jgi:hypothetical protein
MEEVEPYEDMDDEADIQPDTPAVQACAPHALSPVVPSVAQKEQATLTMLLASSLQPERMLPPKPVRMAVLGPPEPAAHPSFWFGTSGEFPVLHPLDHARWACKTGGGKSWLLMRITAQLIAQGVEVWYVNPKYMPLDKEGIDFDPILKRCTKVAIGMSGKDALLLIEEARQVMYDRIKRSRVEKIATFAPMAVVVDELSTLDSAWKELESSKSGRWKDAHNRGVAAIDRLIRWGRQPGVFYLATSQDAQVQNSPTNSGTAGNFGLSACRPNLDPYSLKNILGDKRESKLLPDLRGAYDWWVVTNSPTGQDTVTCVEVPALTNDWILQTVGHVPERAVEAQSVIDSSKNQSAPSMAEVAQKMLEARAALPGEVEIPLPDATTGIPVASMEAPQRAVEAEVEAPLPGMEEPKEWSTTQLRVWGWLSEQPDISQREVARRLFGGKCDGVWNGKAGEVMAQVRKLKETT